MGFEPDYRNIVDVANNRRPKRLPLYEHLVGMDFIGKVHGGGNPLEGLPKEEHGPRIIRELCSFFREMTYDTISYECCVVLPGSGAILGGRPGPIQSRSDFEKYPWDDLPRLYWERHTPGLEALRKEMPVGMKAVGGVGLGVFEISEDLVGYEYLCLLQYDAPELFSALYRKIGDYLTGLWKTMLERYGDLFCVCRMGDDLGFKSNTLIAADTIRSHIIPQYRRITDLVHATNKPFLLHSCGNIFNVMDDIISLGGINAKHSNEDQIAPYEEWINKYSDRIGLFGGVDVNDLCLKKPDVLRKEIVEKGLKYRKTAKGFALGSGNSIPGYVPVEGYMAMIEAAKEIRAQEE